MKKILFSLFFLLPLMVFAQNNEAEKEIKPPLEVVKAFQKEFPKIKPHWRKTYRGENETELNYDGDFVINNINMTAIYNVYGVFKVLHCDIAPNDIPEKALQYLHKNYPNHTIESSIKVMDNSNKTTYEIGIKINNHLSDAIFDAQGDFLTIVSK